MAAKNTGSEALARWPSTLGGPGWQPRRASHAEEVAEGLLWRRCGYRSEVDPLRTVLLARPPTSLREISNPRGALLDSRVDLGLIRSQAHAVAAAFRAVGVEVLVADPAGPVPPNFVFMRDLFLMTSEGAVLARMASAQRAGEERYAAQELARLGCPILATVAGSATFEGADALWLDRETVLVGTGFRTNEAGAAAVRRVLAAQGVRTLSTTLGPGVQHLLGALMLVDHRLAVVHREAATPHLLGLLRERDYRIIKLPADAEVTQARGMNIVVSAPGTVHMPSGAPSVRRRLEDAGLAVHEICVGEYVKAAGGLGCLTGILWRAAEPSGQAWRQEAMPHDRSRDRRGRW